MKMSTENYGIMRDAMRDAIDSTVGILAILELKATVNRTRLLWTLWWIANDSLSHDDNHAFFRGQPWARVAPYRPGWNLYNEGMNDYHIETALVRIGRELGIVD